MADGIGGIGSSGLSSFDLGGIAPNGGGSGPSGTGALGDAGLSPIGSTGLTAFGLDGPVGGQSEAAKLDHYDSLVQQNWDQLNASAQNNAELSRSIAQTAELSRPPAFTMQPIAPPRFDPPPPAFPTFTLLPSATGPAPLPTPPAFAGQPADAAGFTPPAPTAPTFTLPDAAGGPVPAAPFTPFAMAPDALASPVTEPDIPAPVADLDPFAPVGKGGLGLTPPGALALMAFGPGGPVPTEPGAGLPPVTGGLAAFATAPSPVAAPEFAAPSSPTEQALPPWTPFAGAPLAPAPASQGAAVAPAPVQQPSYLAGLLDAAGRGRALSFVIDRYRQAVQDRDGAALPSLSSVVNGVANGSEEAVREDVGGVLTDLDWFSKVANGTVSLTDPETGMISDEAIRRGFNLASLGMTGGLVGTELRAGQTVLGAGPVRQGLEGQAAGQALDSAAGRLDNARLYPDGSLRTPDGKFASVSGMAAPGTANAEQFSDFLRTNGINVVGTEMEVSGPLGVRRYDIVTRNPDGTLHGIEVKSGGATSNAYQRFNDMFINQFGAEGRGQISGQRLTGTTKVYLPAGGME